jgi:hypothetical protein
MVIVLSVDDEKWIKKQKVEIGTSWSFILEATTTPPLLFTLRQTLELPLAWKKEREKRRVHHICAHYKEFVLPFSFSERLIENAN